VPGLLVPSLFTAALLLAAAPARAETEGRPRFEVAVGMGISIDRDAPNPEPDTPVPAYFFTAGLGDGLLGLQLRSFANAGDKRQVVRISGELLGVARPLVPVVGERRGYGYSVMRTLAVELGPAIERVGIDVEARWRAGAVVGAHFDLPVAPTGSATQQLRVRLGVRRLFATSATIAGYPVEDTSLEAYGQLAFVF
jgi:hypothetical protein